MPTLYSLTHATFQNEGMPWVDRIISGQHRVMCGTCGREVYCFDRERPVEATLDSSEGAIWPDCLGCGDYPLFIVSEEFLARWNSLGLPNLPTGEFLIRGNVPSQLVSPSRKLYRWVDGSMLQLAKMDFAGAGFVDVKFCSECGNRTHDISATYRGQRGQKIKYRFLNHDDISLPMFTSDLSPTQLFCTEVAVDMIVKFHLKNFCYNKI